MAPEVSYDYGWWSATILNILLFGGFVLSFLAPTRRHEWRSFGVFLAFIVTLFTEMYGFPLTIYLLTSLLGGLLPLTDPFRHLNGHLWVSLFGGPDWLKQVVLPDRQRGHAWRADPHGRWLATHPSGAR